MLMLHMLTRAKCRIIDDYDSVLVCGPYLSNTTAYYQPNVEFDKQLAFLKGLFMAQLSPDCFSNLVSHACRSMFKECQKVAHDSALKSVMLPSLMVRAARVRSQTIISFDSLNELTQCRSECEKYVSIWETCIDEKDGNAEAKEAFANLRRQFVCYFKRFL